MKLIFVIISLFLIGQTENQESEIYGQWKLIKIETQNEVLIPEFADYFLQVTTEKISYNKDVNNCQSMKLTIINHRIDIEGIMCTEICCDGRIDSISNYIHYSGTYEINENQLIITTADSKLFLERIMD